MGTIEMKNNIASKHMSQKGSGILEVLVMSGILLIIIGFLFQSFTNFSNFQRYKKISLNELFLKNYLNDAVDCVSTAEDIGTTCKPGEHLELLSKSPTKPTLIKDGSEDDLYTKIGSFLVKASCGKENKINIKSKLVNKNNQPVKHPIYKTQGWKKLYKNIDFKCTLNSGI